MSKVVIFGNSDWADLAHVYLTYDSPHDVVAFTVDRDYLQEKKHRGLPVVPFEDIKRSIHRKVTACFSPSASRE